MIFFCLKRCGYVINFDKDANLFGGIGDIDKLTYINNVNISDAAKCWLDMLSDLYVWRFHALLMKVVFVN